MQESQKPIRVLIAEQSELLRAGLSGLIAQMSFCQLASAVNFTGSIANLHTEAAGASADVILIGDHTYQVASGNNDGGAVSNYKRMPLIVLLSDPDMFWMTIESRADGYCLTETNSKVLEAAIKIVADGGAFIGRDLAGYLLHGDGWAKLCRLRPIGDKLSTFSMLSAREREILLLASEGRNNNQIALRLGLKPQTVKAHMNRVLKKLSVSDRTQAVIKALRSL
jgi:DNA-binding NarL/FixJ family response regulator